MLNATKVQVAGLPGCPRRAGKGFTLMEILVALVVVAILASLALPGYSSYMAKGRRTDARSQLLAAQQWLERVYTEGYTYKTVGVGGAAIGTALSSQGFSKSPTQGTAQYVLTISVPDDGQSYTLTATRQTGTSAAGDACGDFTLDSLGVKGIAANTFDSARYSSAQAAARECW
jgi:type IV pilus assembly protein PilE